MAKCFLLLLLLVSLPALAQTDLTGSRDPLGLERFPHSWIVNYERDDEFLPREFIVSRVEKSGRDVHAERKVRTDARLETATYQIPESAPRQEVIEHYLGLLAGELLFTCEGLDCGRSNHWANYIFKLATLFGPDKNQYYIAANHGGHLVGIYIIERGNKRVYAHLQVLEPAQPVAVASNQVLTERLAGNGFVVVDGVTPLLDGRLPDSAQQALKDLAPALKIFAGQRVYVVCHIYGSASAESLLAAAGRCSAAAAKLLGSEGGPELVAFAAGPLLPRGAVAVARIELILPHRLQHR